MILRYWGESQTTGSWWLRRVYSLKETNHHLIRVFTLRNCFYFNLRFVSSAFIANCFEKFEYLVVNCVEFWVNKIIITDYYRCKCNLIMEDVISKSLFEKQKSLFHMLNRIWVFIVLFSVIINFYYYYYYYYYYNDNKRLKRKKMFGCIDV